jgi:putative two-component system hydrogenase maturation factor HypX/HoxX
MRILILTHTFNSLAQKIFAELKARGHILTVEYDINDNVTESAVNKFKPDILIAPFLKRAIPETVWKNVLSLIIHPGPPGDRGPSSLDWAILNEYPNWGVTVIEANGIMDGGPIWAYQTFPMRNVKKGTLYRHEVTEAAIAALLQALERIEALKNRTWSPPLTHHFEICTRPAIKQINRKINWDSDNREVILKKINSADGGPGVLVKFPEQALYLYDAKEYPFPIVGPIGIPLGICDYGVIINTISGPIVVGHMKEKSSSDGLTFKKSADHFFFNLTKYHYPRVRIETHAAATWIYFNFYNGAMGIKECRDLHHAYIEAKKKSSKVIVLKSENDFFSNGIHLNEIEAAIIPADYAWENINMMNDLVYEIITTVNKLTIAIVDGNASAGGVLLARANDLVFGTSNVILNPHYKNMGNLHGSEFWSYLLPKYIGDTVTKNIMTNRLPMEAIEAKAIGIFDEIYDCLDLQKFIGESIESKIQLKKLTRENEELKKPLLQYREEELARMKNNFYGFDPSFHVARYNFVRNIVKSKTPLHIASHRSQL